MSDIESLDEEDREDVVPFQRLTINNIPALQAAHKRIALDIPKLAFSIHQSVTTAEPVVIEDIDDDLKRELAFYSQSLSAVKEARILLQAEGNPFTRPVDYFAEMVKSDEHMGRVKAKLVDEAAGKKAAAEARKQRDLKKFGKQVQVAKGQERDKAKRDTLEKIKVLKRSMSTSIPYSCPCLRRIENRLATNLWHTPRLKLPANSQLVYRTQKLLYPFHKQAGRTPFPLKLILTPHPSRTRRRTPNLNPRTRPLRRRTRRLSRNRKERPRSPKTRRQTRRRRPRRRQYKTKEEGREVWIWW